MSEATICNRCGATIPENMDACPQCNPPPTRKVEALPVFFIIILLCSSFLMLGTSVVNVASFSGPKTTAPSSLSGDLKLPAYYAAKDFVSQRYPGTKTFSDFNQTPLEQDGNSFKVMLSTDEITPANSRVRNFFTVELELVGNSWNLKAIKQ